MEHVWSHVLGYLYGAYISTAIIAVCLFVYDWRLARGYCLSVGCTGSFWSAVLAAVRLLPAMQNGRKKLLFGYQMVFRKH